MLYSPEKQDLRRDNFNAFAINRTLLRILTCTSIMYLDECGRDKKVRDKMLYSSSKQDLRQGLGLGFFEGDYYANVKDDLRFDSLVASRRGGRGDQLLSDAE